MGQYQTTVNCDITSVDRFAPDEYKPLKILGNGMFGQVILCKYQNKLLAVKFYNSGQDQRPKESDIACIVSNIPGFIRVHNIYKTNQLDPSWSKWLGPFYRTTGSWNIISMDRGESNLYDLYTDIMKENTVLDWSDLVSIILQVIISLSTAWSVYGLCHNDIKLENIVYTLDATPKVVSFEFGDVTIASAYRTHIIDFGQSNLMNPDSDYCTDMKGFLVGIELFKMTVSSDHARELTQLRDYLDDDDFDSALSMSMFESMITFK